MEVVVLESCSSTNDEAWARHGDGPTLVVACTQNGGRGREGRVWQSSQKGNLYTSLWLPPLAEPGPVALIPLLAGVAAAEVVARSWREGRRQGFRLKWPNDLMLANAKCGGILCESRWNCGRLSGVVVGLGLNLLYTPEVSDRAVTSLASAGCAMNLPTETWAKNWAEEVLRLVSTLERDGPATLLLSWQEFARLDQFPDFETHIGGAIQHYRALGLDDHGRLRVRNTATGIESFLNQAN